MDLNEERFKLNKDIPIPLYYQVKRMILNELASGKLQLGDKLPAENEFCEHLQLSRPTVRLALNELVAEGILVRQKRSGTFVAEPKIELFLQISIEHFQDYLHKQARDCSVEQLDLCVVDKIGEINQRLKIPGNEQLIYLKRMWSIGDTHIVYNATYLPQKRFSDILEKDFSQRSLLEVLRQDYGIQATCRKVKIEAVLASKNDITLLGIDRTRASLLYVAEMIQEKDGTPLCWSISRYRGDKVFLSYDAEITE